MRVDKPAQVFLPDSYQDATGSYGYSPLSGNLDSWLKWEVSTNHIFLLEWYSLTYSYTRTLGIDKPKDRVACMFRFQKATSLNWWGPMFYSEEVVHVRQDILMVFNPGSTFYAEISVVKDSVIDACLTFCWKGRSWENKNRDWGTGEKNNPPFPPTRTYTIGA